MTRLTTFFGVIPEMLLRLDDHTIDPAGFRETLAVRFSIPQEWEVEAFEGIARCGVMYRNPRNYKDVTWLPFEEGDQFEATVLLQQSAPPEDGRCDSWLYEVTIWYQSRRVIPWTITLIYHPSTWHVAFGPAGSGWGVSVLLPDYVPLPLPQT